MPKQFFSRLSRDYIDILKDDDYYDITIEVGQDPNVKIFRAHRIILCYRSPFLRQTLTSNRENNNGTLINIKLPNISPEIFQVILKYIYGGIISLNEHEASEILKILVAANELLLQELIDYLQEYLIKNKSEWIEQHIILTYRISFQSNSLLGLQKFCADFMNEFPEKIFKSLDFTSLSEASLISIIKKDDLQMKEIEIWEHVLKWGLEKNPSLLPDSTTWSDNDFKVMENTLQNCIPEIRFFSLSSKDFSQKVRPYRKLLKHQLYEELLGSYLDSNIEPIKGTDEILGGYNPLIWKSYNVGQCGKTKDSFIFSFKSKDNFRDLILSRVKNVDKAIYYKYNFGPTFYDDIDIYVMKGGIEPSDIREYNYSHCKQKSYEKKVRDTEDKFSVEDYEVFQIIKIVK
ncbi:BTB/POZ protein [Rhizophagus clarus]|uniref:BTB/POZ protein n=1 Tax=Rhizophagus clarus TaxID=94130 RepID=A0A8H3LKF0_9GLOM|nr:BTB/POZ protein [Rhizophagus clarus]